MSNVDEGLIRFHLLMQDREQERRDAARQRSDKASPYFGAATFILIVGLVAGFAANRADLGVASLVLLLALDVAHQAVTENQRPSRVAAVRSAALQVLAVECPECHAPTGRRCTLPALDVRVCHEARGHFYWQTADRLAHATLTDAEEPQP